MWMKNWRLDAEKTRRVDGLRRTSPGKKRREIGNEPKWKGMRPSPLTDKETHIRQLVPGRAGSEGQGGTEHTRPGLCPQNWRVSRPPVFPAGD